MRIRTLALALLLSGTVMAGDVSSIDIKVLRDEDAFSFSSTEAGFNPLDLQVGENRSYVDENGRNVLITRTEEGFTVDADGQQFEIPAPGILRDGELHHAHAIEVEERVVLPGPDETLIITKSPVDDATQDAIRSLLKDSGHDADVRFVDGSKRPPGPPRHGVHVIRKALE